MVSATEFNSRRRTFVLRPNQAPAWRQIRWFFLCIACTSLTVAASFAAMGFWPILPFAGLEIGALGVALYVTAKRAEIREVVSVDADRIKVARGRRRPEQRWEFQSVWTQVQLESPVSKLYPSRLVIRSHGRELELGRFLVEEERQQLAGELRLTLTAQ